MSFSTHTEVFQRSQVECLTPDMDRTKFLKLGSVLSLAASQTLFLNL